MRSNFSLLIIGFSLVLPACEESECPPHQERVGTACRSVKFLSPDASVGNSEAEMTPPAPPVFEQRDANVMGKVGGDSGPNRAGGSTAVVDGGTETRDAAPPDASGPLAHACLVDADRDGYGAGPATGPCSPLEPAPMPGDCNDSASTSHPAAKEICADGIDNDCNGKADDGQPEECNGLDDDCDPSTPDGEGACADFACRNGACLTACNANADCINGLYCVAGACMVDNDGASCASSEECSSGFCCTLQSCPERYVCRLSQGKSCTENSQCASGACYKACLFHKSNLDEVCDDRGDCARDLECFNGRCKSTFYCKNDSDCISGHCLTSACAPLPKSPLHGPCDHVSDCMPYMMCDGVTLTCKRIMGQPCADSSECITTQACINGICDI